MSYFDSAIKYVLQHEGGLVNDPADAGGLTKFGITKRDYPHLDIAGLTEHDAIEIYRKDYWRPIYDEISDQKVAIKLFDMAVNMGHRQAHQLLQRAVGVDDDGIFGPKTLQKVNQCYSTVDRLCAVQSEFYKWLVERKPSQRKFLRGWLKRANWRP